jgi:hypothetical protein
LSLRKGVNLDMMSVIYIVSINSSCAAASNGNGSLTKGTEKKGKAIPLQAWTGPEGSRRLRLADFKTVGT